METLNDSKQEHIEVQMTVLRSIVKAMNEKMKELEERIRALEGTDGHD